MKKVFVAMLTIVAIFSFVACGNNETPKFSELMVADTDEYKVYITAADFSSGVTLDVSEEYFNPDFLGYIEGVYINGVFFEEDWYEENNENSYTVHFGDDLILNGEEKITSVKFAFTIYDYTEDAVVAEIPVQIYPYGEENATIFIRTPQPTDELIFENDITTITVINYFDSDFESDGVCMHIANNGESELYIEAENVVVNGIPVYHDFYPNIPAESNSISTLKWWPDASDSASFNNVDSIQFSLTLYLTVNGVWEPIYQSGTITLNPTRDAGNNNEAQGGNALSESQQGTFSEDVLDSLEVIVTCQEELDALPFREDAAKITSVIAESSQINNLSPLSSLINLRKLDLDHNEIEDVEPLSNLTNLETLILTYNNIEDVSALSSLTNLTHLELFGRNTNADISPLSNLTKLRSLRLFSNNINDISHLSKLTELTDLDLSGNNIDNIGPLSTLSESRNVDLSGNNISDLRPLSKLTNMEMLLLANNNLNDVKSLSKLSKLKTLNLSKNSISELDPLSKLTNLETLILSSNNISDVSPLLSLENLVDLDLSFNYISDLSEAQALYNLPKLSYLNLDNND